MPRLSLPNARARLRPESPVSQPLRPRPRGRFPLLISAVLLLAVAACSKPPAPEVLLRDPKVPVRSIAGFDPARIRGEWVQAAALAAPGTSCTSGRLSIRPEGAALRMEGDLCLGGRMERISSRATPSGPGRMQLSGQSADWWVIWADWDMRTLVLADPKGSFAVILDRGRISPDRMKAARDLLDFNGYAVSALR